MHLRGKTDVRAHDDDEDPDGGVHKHGPGQDHCECVGRDGLRRASGGRHEGVRAGGGGERECARGESARGDGGAQHPVEDDDADDNPAREDDFVTQRLQQGDHLTDGHPAQAVERVEAEPPHAEHVHLGQEDDGFSR